MTLTRNLTKIYNNAGLVLPFIATVFALIVAGYIDAYLAFIATSWLIFGLLGLSLDIVWGRGGFLSLGQTVSYGLGGYFGSILAINMVDSTGNSLVWALPAGAIVGAFAAALLGLIIFYARIGALQSTILSYTFTLLLWTLSQSFNQKIGQASVGGDNGMTDIPSFVIAFGEDAQRLNPNQTFATVVLICAFVYFVTRFLMKSRFGRIIDCIRIDVQKTETLGYDIRKYQLINFCYAGGVAGLAGAMFGLWANYLNPSIFSVQEAMLVPIYVLIGGLGSLSGAFVGALLIGGLSFWLGGGVVGGQTTLVLGAVLIVLVMFLKKGVLGSLDELWFWFMTRQSSEKYVGTAVIVDANIIDQIFKDTKAQVFSISQLTKTFGGVTPVNNLSYLFELGRPYALIGPNGAGKSSLLKTCMGLYKQDDGRMFLGEKEIGDKQIFERVQQGLGVKNQKPQVFGELTIGQNLLVAAFSRTKNTKISQQICQQVADMLGFKDQSSTLASALSHGQQQWLDIGMLLCLAPEVMFLDEPAAGMTKLETEQLSKLIGILAKYIVVIVVEHNMEFVESLDPKVVVLNQGEIFAEGDMQSIRQNDRVLDIYLGRRAHA